MRLRPLALPALVALVAVLAMTPVTLSGQGGLSRYGEGRHYRPIRVGHPEVPGGFTFCRLAYTSVRSEASGYGWSTDYPRGDLNLTLRLSELTTAPISRWFDGEPGIAAVFPDDPDLFRCGFLMASDVGTMGLAPVEIAALRTYLLKGGVFWGDDFWGDAAWAQFSREMKRVLPEYDFIDLPLDHPLFSIVYTVESIPQISHLQFWRSSGGETSERGFESAVPRLRAILDENGRILVLATHNTDIADGWEREADDATFFALFSPPAYALGINIATWILTH